MDINLLKEFLKKGKILRYQETVALSYEWESLQKIECGEAICYYEDLKEERESDADIPKSLPPIFENAAKLWSGKSNFIWSLEDCNWQTKKIPIVLNISNFNNSRNSVYTILVVYKGL